MLHVCNMSRHMCVCSADAWGQAIHFRSTQCLHALCPPHPSSIEALLHLQTLTKYMISLRMRKPLYLPDSNNSVLNRGGMTVSCLSTSFEHAVWHNLQYFALFFLMAWPCLFLALPKTIMCNFANGSGMAIHSHGSGKWALCCSYKIQVGSCSYKYAAASG